MANEISVRSALQVKNGSLDYRANPTAYNADQTGVGGPTPGAIHITTNYGKKVDLSALVVPGFARIQNLHGTLSIEVGIHNGEFFYPVIELGPGQFTDVPLSRHLNYTESVTGTGTLPQTITDLWVKPLTMVPADGSGIWAIFDVFER